MTTTEFKELQCGNFVKVRGDAGIYQVRAKDDDTLFVRLDRPKGAHHLDCDWIEAKRLEQIKLTEDWLPKFSFVRDILDNDKNEYGHPDLPRSTVLRFSPIKQIGCYAINYLTPNWEGKLNLKSLGFVHQLQNWFFAYTGGQELKIKEA